MRIQRRQRLIYPLFFPRLKKTNPFHRGRRLLLVRQLGLRRRRARLGFRVWVLRLARGDQACLLHIHISVCFIPEPKRENICINTIYTTHIQIHIRPRPPTIAPWEWNRENTYLFDDVLKVAVQAGFKPFPHKCGDRVFEWAISKVSVVGLYYSPAIWG